MKGEEFFEDGFRVAPFMRVKAGREIIPVVEQGIDVFELFEDAGVVGSCTVRDMLMKQVSGIQKALEVVLAVEKAGDVGRAGGFFTVECCIGESGVKEGGEAGGMEVEGFIAEEGEEEGVEAGEGGVGVMCHYIKV
ncbi:MAG: hypothetical protein DI535_05975 [Citrobacter freundii]|nr:MAG: hypothetical protein DI535_05975 [Citrobacter freundii]